MSHEGLRRAVRLGEDSEVHGILDLRLGATGVDLSLTLPESVDDPPSHVAEAERRVRRWLDLDAAATEIDHHLAQDQFLAPRVAATPGLRVPGAVDPFESAVRAIIGQQISVAGARTVAGRLALAIGSPLAIPDPALTHLFPDPEQILRAPDELFAMPSARRTTIRSLARAVLEGTVDLEDRPDTPREKVRDALLEISGIGPWTASYIAMRALGDRDVFLATDLGVVRTLQRSDTAPDPQRWRPYRSYALHHIWQS